MFEYFVFVKEEAENIAALTDERFMNDNDVSTLLCMYDNPFWYISADSDKIKLEIHADMSYDDTKWFENYFKETVMHIADSFV